MPKPRLLTVTSALLITSIALAQTQPDGSRSGNAGQTDTVPDRVQTDKGVSSNRPPPTGAPAKSQSGEVADPQSRRAAEAWLEYQRRMKLEQRVRGKRPQRRDAPLRADNLSDNEAREIQTIVATIRPGAIVNIGAVVEGCPCEEGPSCSDQVWVVAYRPERSTGLNLSRVGQHWVIGPTQSWWLEYDSLLGHRKSYESAAAFDRASQELLDRFPVCSAAPAVAAGPR